MSTSVPGEMADLLWEVELWRISFSLIWESEMGIV